MWRAGVWFARTYPLRASCALVFLILSGLAEGIGIAALLPLLSLIMDAQSGSQTQVGQAIEQALLGLGVEPAIGNLLALIVGVMVLKAVFLLLAISQTGFFAADITRNQRKELLNAVIFARWEYFHGERTGDFVQALGDGAGKISGTCLQFTGFLARLIQVTVLVVIAYMISWWITIVALCIGGLSVMLLSRFITMARLASRAQTAIMRSFVSQLIDGLTAIKSIKSMGREHQLIPLLEHDIEGLKRAQRRSILSTEALRIIPEPISTIAIASGLYFTFDHWSGGLEALFAIIFLFSRILGSVNALQRYYKTLASGQASFWFVHNLTAHALQAAEPANGTITPSLSEAIELRDVTFAYGEKLVLSDVSLTVKAGSYVCFTGLSGVGKTTTADLIIGLLRPISGEIYIDGVEMAEIDLKAWRRLIGYVPQDTILFHDSIYVNVTLGDPSIDRESVAAALRQAGADDFVSELPEGIDTVVGERGLRFSGGQRQRIAIARALVRRPTLLILDEATTSLDPETEAGICRTLREIRSDERTGNMTILAISHQKALVEAADTGYRVDRHQIFPVDDADVTDSTLSTRRLASGRLEPEGVKV